MEATMYDDNVTSPPNAKKRKIEMTLDLQSGKTKQEKVNELLTTPDVGMFMLTSPDLERFIIQQNGLVLTTPTPTQILFPRTVTEEQEAYARGFVEALGELHKNNGPAVSVPYSGIGIINQATPIVSRAATSMSGMSGVPAPIAYVTLSNSGAASAGNPLLGGQPVNMIAQRLQQSQLPPVSRAPSSFPTMVKVESVPPQTVPNTLLPPADIRPIDMDEQEMAKLERKRARNRVAATRCRNRKLERISRLEERVAELKDQNAKLMESAAMLRDEVHRLKSGIIEHTRRGCQVMLTHNLL